MAHQYTAADVKSDKVTAESWRWMVILRQNHPYEWLEMKWRAYLKKNQIGEGCPAVFAEVADFVAQRLIPLLPRAKTLRNTNAFG